MTPVAEALFINGLSSVARQISRRFLQKYFFTFQMRRRLGGKLPDDLNLKVLDALQRALGNFRSLTPATNSSLIDIANSSLFEHLVAIFGSDLDHSNAKSFIEYIHQSRGSVLEKDSVQFAQDLSVCLTLVHETIFDFTQEGIPNEFTGQIRRALDDDAKRADAIITNTIQKLKDKEGSWLQRPDVSAASVAAQIKESRDPIKNYVNALKKTMNSVDVHGASGDVVQVPLDEIFVDVPVSYIDRKRNFNPYQDLRTNISRYRVSNSWEETLEHIKLTVLLGDPGGGKSTLSKKLCLESCDRYIGGQTKLPIYIQLRTYISKAADDERLSLTHYIIDFISSTMLDENRNDISSTVMYHLRVGTVFFIADGLDEVLTSANRARVVKELAVFRKEYPLCQILVTSRYVGYETQPLEGFSHLGVDFLDDSAIEQIYRNVSSAVLNRTDAEIESRLSAFLIDARKKADELIKSPLLLTLIVIIYDKKSEIPDNRSNLYSFCADLLFDQWDKFRDILPDLPERYRLFDLFKHLSALLYENEEYGGRINKDDLEKEAREFFKLDYIDNREGRSAAAAKQMIGHLTGRAWILHEVGENIYEFTHRTFMEFFYAKYLDTVYEDTSLLIENCIKHVAEGRRTLPTHLALQIRTKNKRAASSKVAELLTLILRDSNGSQELLYFCLDTLGYILPSADELSQFVSVLSDNSMKSNNPLTHLRLLCSQNPLRNSILQICSKDLEKVSNVGQIRALAPALYRMSREGLSAYTDANGSKIDVVKPLLDRNYSKQPSSPYVCKLAFDLDCKVNLDAAGKFGIRLWNNNNTDPSHYLRLLFDSQAILVEASRKVLYADAHTGKHYELARAVYQSFLQIQKITFSINISLHIITCRTCLRS